MSVSLEGDCKFRPCVLQKSLCRKAELRILGEFHEVCGKRSLQRTCVVSEAATLGDKQGAIPLFAFSPFWAVKRAYNITPLSQAHF